MSGAEWLLSVGVRANGWMDGWPDGWVCGWMSGAAAVVKDTIYVVFALFSLQPVFCSSSSARLESLNPDALQSRKSNSSSYLRLKTGFLCGERGRGRGGRREKCCRVIFRLNVPLHNNLHKQPCVCDKKIGNFQRLCGD